MGGDNCCILYALVDGVCGVDHRDGVLEDLDDGVVDEFAGRHKLIQLGGQHCETVQVFAVGDEQAPTVVALAPLDALGAKHLQHGLPGFVLIEHSLEWNFGCK